MTDWDKRFIDLAAHVATWSKDPSTKVGAVIARGKFIESLGYNGFPAGVQDRPIRLEIRENKYRYMIHAEENALLTAKKDLSGCVCYTWPMQPCARCAGRLAQVGIARVVAPRLPTELASRWADDIEIAMTIFKEAGIKLELR